MTACFPCNNGIHNRASADGVCVCCGAPQTRSERGLPCAPAGGSGLESPAAALTKEAQR